MGPDGVCSKGRGSPTSVSHGHAPQGWPVFSRGRKGQGRVTPCDLDQQVSSLPGALASPSIKWENNCHSANFTELLAGVITHQFLRGWPLTCVGEVRATG